MELVKTNENGTISSLELVKQVNVFRKAEANSSEKTYKELRHDTMLSIVRDEFEEEISLQKILESNYTNTRGRNYVMFELTLGQAKQVLMRESKYVRKAMIAYINELENKLDQQFKLPSTYKEALLQLVEQVEINEKLELENQQLTTEVFHKEDVIIGLTKDITLAEKRQLINNIIRFNARGKFADRWNLLYKEFDQKFRVDTKRRLNNAIENGELNNKTKRIDYICDVMELTHELYDVAVKVFESDYKKLMQQKIETI